MAKKKVAMLAPVPKFSDRPVISGPSSARLAVALSIIGNDRAYTVLSIKGNTWVVHFEGDTTPKIITFESDKPEVL